MNIRLATIEDYAYVNEIVKEGHDEHAEALPHIFQKVVPVMPISYFKELLDEKDCDILIAVEEGEIVGFAVMELKQSPPFDSMTPRIYAYMSDFGVKSNSQRKGIGTKLFQACVDWSKDKGATSLDLNVWEFNNRAISFYESFGLETVSRKMSLTI
ncbi:GNAT family N-acetyltransferase [Bacillus sp. 31A1R]|uniref:GNAT family N-acetyltransferase n=1 Tax=Robertmurraya mangrovi TaxID=3098077 RepID=A0ABU5J136_9BACI|nr:GNAT family N-acetyltransferase [Bacillus sp. 31A1R]MDZ5473062.1 GNAT family N-acetyltransferase [Bacillus sp. 31A1R]